MKQFDLAEYLENPSKKVVTRDGRKARIVATDIKCKNFPIVAAVTYGDGHEVCLSYTSSGKYSPSITKDYNDLLFAPEKHEGWFNIYHSDESGFYVRQYHPYNSKDEADEVAKANPKTFFTTIKVEWEE